MIQPDILCIGSVLWDIIGRAPRVMPVGADVPGRITRQPGGVALNIAMALARHGLCPALLSAVGRDAEGEDLMRACAALGLLTDTLHRPHDLPTDRYMAVEGANGLIAAVADAGSLEAAGPAILAPLADGRLGSPSRPWAGPVALDGNLTEGLLSNIATSPLFARADLRLASASTGKAARLAPLLSDPRATLYVNLEEAGILCGTPLPTAPEAAEALLTRGLRRVLVTDGARKAAEGWAGQGLITAQPPAVAVVRVTGAGDSFMAAHIAADLGGADRAAALDAGLRAAAQHISQVA
jgi:sugar/nucleoside kinase (ribokinase family)